MDHLKSKYLTDVEAALVRYDDKKSLTSYKRLNHSVTLLAHVLLIQRAETSSMCAIELSKAYPFLPPLDYNLPNQDVLKSLENINLNNDNLDNILRRNDLQTKIGPNLDSAKIKEALHAGQVSIDQAQKLMRIVHLEKESENHQDINITVNEGSMLDAI